MVGPLLKARQAIEQQTDDLDRQVLKLARYDAQVRRFMTVPGVGPTTALCFKATIGDPTRFKRSKSVGAYVGLTTRRTVGPARMIAESLTPKPGIGEQNRPKPDITAEMSSGPSFL